ncbi:Oxidoreductase molybdopterin binding domain protein [Thalassovita gelatinovora]|uniref:Oxidoreductase molybdopterin binding domain protein n=1 Tax=Thalassovita gelatinovora TaxID=53501 RepID=A0A0P1F3Y9_THAGE|nr:hypothetical protein [Thalassovita gelatinovora]QIZ79259.1 oxidoreductase [Thalassovita gelatinovora]CUH62456.1 Oxidoreductase molybdopterin binding domain protein [Thalassovita gelatinovora]SEQ04645.1 hypothetical protein SAMN04488043_10315 [Thalassovita gelatinovora]
MSRIISTVLAAAFTFVGWASVAVAEGLPVNTTDQDQSVNAQEQEFLLEFMYPPGAEREAVYMTLDDLQNLPHAGFETTTIWTEGLQTFEGVWLKDLVRHLEVSEGTLELSALNEYLIEMNVEEIADSHALVAYMRNGKPMTAREKGPLWIVFPYDSDPKFQSETVYARSIWQLDRISLLQ